MVNQELLQYIKRQIDSGVALEAVKGALKEAGWSGEDIKNALREAGAAEPVAESPSKEGKVVHKNGKTILLIDDESEFREIFSTKLNIAGFNVLEAGSGAEGIEVLKKSKPDLVLLDFKMPEQDGVETLAKIKADSSIPLVRVVFLTNYGEPLPIKELTETDKRFAQEMGAHDFLRKTEDLDEVVRKVKEIIAQNHSGVGAQK